MKQINIVFEKEVCKNTSDGVVCNDCTNGQRWVTEKAQVLIPFGNLNTAYDNATSYNANFEKFIRDSFECGFVFLSEEYAIPVFKILAFIAVKEASDKETKTDVASTNAAPTDRPIVKEQQKENPMQNRGNNRMRRHGKWRNFKRRQGNGNGNNGGNVPNVPTPSLPVEQKSTSPIEFGESPNP